jgi:ribosomal protein S18 acetylase RimI-like enzyme
MSEGDRAAVFGKSSEDAATPFVETMPLPPNPQGRKTRHLLWIPVRIVDNAAPPRAVRLHSSIPRFKMREMLLTRATEADYPAIIDLANIAYRGTGPSASWNVESGIIEGQRLNESLLREDVDGKPDGHLLTCRDQSEPNETSETRKGETLLGCVWLEPKAHGTWYLGLLAVQPDLQKRQLGRNLLAAAEDYARERGARHIRLGVLMVRDVLIAWYERRGYTKTGQTQPFPYGDDRFGKPLRDDLHFVMLEKEI